jgi:threonine/homoserine/homoserine lactone efflux protein
LTTTNLLFFLTASLALIVVPGPDTIYVITRGVSQGRRTAMLSALGVSSGLLIHTILAAVGLSALLAQSAAAFQVVKYAGAAYLIYLGVKTLLNRQTFAGAGEPGPPAGRATVFFQGMASNVLNPKVALFFLSFLPQFVVSGAAGAAPQLLLLGLTFAALGLLFLSVVAYFSGTVGDWIGDRPGFASGMRWLTGCVLIGLGLRLALPERS